MSQPIQAKVDPELSQEVALDAPDGDVIQDAASLSATNELTANTFGEWLAGFGKRARSGQSGALPVVVGLILIIVIFQIENSHFLSAGNLTNLLEQSGLFILLGMAEVFALLLGEIDLSAGYVAGLGATITAELATQPHNVNWFLAILAGVAVCAVIGAIHGLLITRLGLPSFVVTLAGLLGWEGLQIHLIQADKQATGGTINVTNNILNDIVNGSLSTTAGWIVLVVAIIGFAISVLAADRRRRSAGLVTPPIGVTLLKVATVAVAGVVVVLVCNTNRGSGLVSLKGVPWVVLLVLVVLFVYNVLLGRLRFGRYMYAIGGNAEAARRAGVSLKTIRLFAFVLASFTAGIAGVVYLSQLGAVTTNVDGGNLVLYAVAAAVIGGTSLFGGRGKMVHAVLGGLVIAALYNGMALISLTAAAQYMVTALVLLAAVIIDALARRGQTTR